MSFIQLPVWDSTLCRDVWPESGWVFSFNLEISWLVGGGSQYSISEHLPQQPARHLKQWSLFFFKHCLVLACKSGNGCTSLIWWLGGCNCTASYISQTTSSFAHCSHSSLFLLLLLECTNMADHALPFIPIRDAFNSRLWWRVKTIEEVSAHFYWSCNMWMCGDTIMHLPFICLRLLLFKNSFSNSPPPPLKIAHSRARQVIPFRNWIIELSGLPSPLFSTHPLNNHTICQVTLPLNSCERSARWVASWMADLKRAFNGGGEYT